MKDKVHSIVNVKSFDANKKPEYELPIFISYGYNHSLYQIIRRLDGLYSIVSLDSGVEQSGGQSSSLSEFVKERIDNGAVLVNLNVEISKR